MEKKTYIITERAGPRVAGRRIEDGQTTIELTPHEALAEVLAGTLILEGAQAKPVKPKRAKTKAVETSSKAG